MSQTKHLDIQDWKNWLLNLRVFLTPLVIIYLVPILALIQMPGHVINLSDFAFTQSMIGASTVYVLNAILDLSRKYYSGPTQP